MMRCLSKGRKTNGIVTRFSLVKATNKGGISYAKATFSMERELAKDEAVLIEKLTEQLKNISQKVGFEGAADSEQKESEISVNMTMPA